MDEFAIKGTGNFVKITFDEVYGFPDKTCTWGGYDVRSTIEIKSRGFQVKATLFTSTGEIFEFYEQLKLRNEQLNGVAHFNTYEWNLDLNLEYDILGHVNVRGTFTERIEYANKLNLNSIQTKLI